MSRPKMPTNVRIGVHNWRILRKTKEQMKDEESEAGHDMGLCVYENQEIHIQRGIRLSRQQEVLLHEIKHACMENLTFTDESLKDAYKAEEAVVNFLSPVLLQVIQDNPELVTFLQYKEAKKNGRFGKSKLPPALAGGVPPV